MCYISLLIDVILFIIFYNYVPFCKQKVHGLVNQYVYPDYKRNDSILCLASLAVAVYSVHKVLEKKNGYKNDLVIY